MSLSKVKMLQAGKCLIGLAVMMLQSCDVADNRRDMLCGNWVIKLDKKQPIVSPATEKGNREGRMVMASAMRNWIAPKLIN